MKMLKHRPEGKSIPKGKPFVYFLSHEKDFNIYFESISRQLLRAAECMIFYDDGTGEDCDEQTRLYDISQMKLVVVPVTVRFLSDPECDAARLLRYAISERVNILPILQEKGIEGEFNRQYGSMHMLSVGSDNDGGVISLDEKIKRFLSAALIGDELAEKVRAAFDAYIFLSYRKKDRIYANELMRLIHKNEFCRDIAIWYDEFLTPGENFNREIESALEKSRLFALAVTPNLINERNYVMEVEYPLAKNSKKPILPVELVPTDKDTLRVSFENIPSIINPYDSAELSDALIGLLENIALRENDSDPEHNFFIGLAYLSGIDVEIDKERAVRLITGSAEADLPEAIEKLIDLYSMGGAVNYNPDEAFKWRTKLVEVLKREHQASPTEENYRKLLDAMCNLADDWKSKNSIVIYEEALDLAKELVNKNNNELNERYLSFGYGALADAYGEMGRRDEAEVCYKEMIAIDQRLAKAYTNHFYKRNLARDYFKYAKFYRFKMSNRSRALELFNASKDIYESLLTEERTAETINGLCETYSYIGDNCKSFVEYENGGEPMKNLAEQSYKRVLELRLEQVGEFESLDALSDLGSAYASLSDFYKTFDMPDKSIEYQLLRINNNRRSYEITDELSYLAGIDELITYLVEYYIELGRFTEAHDLAGELVDNANKYTYSPFSFWNPSPGYALIKAYRTNAQIYEGLGDWEKELSNLKSAIDVSEWVAENYHISHLQTTYWEYTGLASRYLAQGMNDEAEECARRGFDCMVKTIREHSIATTFSLMRYASEDICFYLERVGKPDEAEKYKPCREIYNRVCSDEDENLGEFVNLANMFIDYADGCDRNERAKWRLRVLELLHFIKGIVKDTAAFIDLYNDLLAEFPDAELR